MSPAFLLSNGDVHKLSHTNGLWCTNCLWTATWPCYQISCAFPVTSSVFDYIYDYTRNGRSLCAATLILITPMSYWILICESSWHTARCYGFYVLECYSYSDFLHCPKLPYFHALLSCEYCIMYTKWGDLRMANSLGKSWYSLLWQGHNSIYKSLLWRLTITLTVKNGKKWEQIDTIHQVYNNLNWKHFSCDRTCKAVGL